MNTTSSATRSQHKRNRPITDPEPMVRRAMDDIALIVGGAAALHQLDDDLVWTLMKRLDRVRIRLVRDLRGVTGNDDLAEAVQPQPPRVHAAVDEFLARNHAGAGE